MNKKEKEGEESRGEGRGGKGRGGEGKKRGTKQSKPVQRNAT